VKEKDLVERVKSCMFPDASREYVVIAHAQDMERKWLQLKEIIKPERRILDTQAIDRHIRNSSQLGALISVCQKLGIRTANLHNAGNDAAFELTCLLRFACLAGRDYDEYEQGYQKDFVRAIAWVNEG